MTSETEMEERYKNHFIRATANLNPHTKRWDPIVSITWDEDGTMQFHGLSGLRDLFKTQEEAERYAIQMARKWIDDKVPVVNK